MENFLVAVTVDGETVTQSLGQFLTDNEVAIQTCEIVKNLKPGMSYSPMVDITYTRVERPTRKKSRMASFVTDWSFDGSKKVKVLINRDTGVMTIRPFHRRKVVYANLGDLCQIAMTRAAAREAGVSTKAKRRRVA